MVPVRIGGAPILSTWRHLGRDRARPELCVALALLAARRGGAHPPAPVFAERPRVSGLHARNYVGAHTLPAADRHRITTPAALRCARQLTATSVRSLNHQRAARRRAAAAAAGARAAGGRLQRATGSAASVATCRSAGGGAARELAPAEPRAAFHATAPSNSTLHASWPVEGARPPAERRWLRELGVALRRADTGALVWERHVRSASLVPLST